MKESSSASQDVRTRIINNGSLSPEENEQIYERWFKPGPRRRAMHVMRAYGLTDASTVDIGSGYGNNLLYLGAGSYGIEINQAFVDFSNHIGLTAYVRDVAKSDLADLPKVDNAIAWAVMEHVDAQHIFLRNVASVLHDNGRLFLYVPTVPAFIPNLLPQKLRKYWKGHLHGDHVNAYTARTLRFVCERAGFETVSVSPGFYGLWTFLNYIPGINNFFDGSLYIGRKIPNWSYPPGSTRKDGAERPH